MAGDRKKCVVLLSGGLDSTTVLAITKQQNFEVNAISFRYGQRHSFELERATRSAARANVSRHVIVDINLGQFGGSALTSAIPVPKHDRVEEIGAEIPVTYVPARNTVFLSLALAWAESLGARDLFIGVNALDYSGYPDCRPEFIEAFERMANLGTKAGVDGSAPIRIHAPLIRLTKAEIIQCGLQLGVDYSDTISCYDPDSQGRACGHCDACLLRLRGFKQIGIQDPSVYSSASDAM